MKVLQKGYRYELKNLGNPDRPGQVLQFIEKKRTDGHLALINDGTTNAELARVLLNRLDDLQGKWPSDEVEKARAHFETGLHYLEARTARRTARATERKHFG